MLFDLVSLCGKSWNGNNKQDLFVLRDSEFVTFTVNNDAMWQRQQDQESHLFTRTGTGYVVYCVVIHKAAARWLERADHDTAQWCERTEATMWQAQ